MISTTATLFLGIGALLGFLLGIVATLLASGRGRKNYHHIEYRNSGFNPPSYLTKLRRENLE